VLKLSVHDRIATSLRGYTSTERQLRTLTSQP
jgi:hypothetical protein